EFTAELPTVRTIVDAIIGIYEQEKAQREAGRPVKNYFIVVGHSQGNFFVEGVAYRLRYSARYSYSGAGRDISATRLGIVSLASPTSYDSLPSDFVVSKIVHHTRADDAINILVPLAAVIPNKHPWPLAGADAALWPWKRPAPQRFFALDQLAP